MSRKEGDLLQLFVNAVKAGEVTLAENPDYTRGFVPEIGGNSGADADAFGGSIDEVRFYDRALTDEEITLLYSLEKFGVPRIEVAIKTVRLRMLVAEGYTYQLESSTDGGTWSAVGMPFVATTPVLDKDVDVANGHRLFRVRIVSAPQ